MNREELSNMINKICFDRNLSEYILKSNRINDNIKTLVNKLVADSIDPYDSQFGENFDNLCKTLGYGNNYEIFKSTFSTYFAKPVVEVKPPISDSDNDDYEIDDDAEYDKWEKTR